MEQTALILIVLTNALLVTIIGIFGILGYKMYKQHVSKENPQNDQYHPEILKRMKEVEKVKPNRSHLFCPNHPEEPGETVCAICDKLFCKACIRPHKTMHLCREHMPLLMRYEWDEVITLKTSTHDPEQGVKLYDFKKDLFQNDDIPTYVETHYKINVDQDYIETYLVLFAQKESIVSVKDRLEKHLGTAHQNTFIE